MKDFKCDIVVSAIFTIFLYLLSEDKDRLRLNYIISISFGVCTLELSYLQDFIRNFKRKNGK